MQVRFEIAFNNRFLLPTNTLFFYSLGLIIFAMVSPDQHKKKSSHKKSKKKSASSAVGGVTTGVPPKEETEKVAQNVKAIQQLIGMMESVRGDQVTTEGKAHLIAIHELLRTIQKRNLKHSRRMQANSPNGQAHPSPDAAPDHGKKSPTSPKHDMPPAGSEIVAKDGAKEASKISSPKKASPPEADQSGKKESSGKEGDPKDRPISKVDSTKPKSNAHWAYLVKHASTTDQTKLSHIEFSQ